MAIWPLTKKESRLLLRDRLSAGILFAMPLLFILILGLLLGEGFGQKADDRLRVSVVNNDLGYNPRRAVAALQAGMPNGLLPALGTYHVLTAEFRDWSAVVQQDLGETAGIRVELIATTAEAEELVRDGRRPAVLEFGPLFSERVHACSFLSEKGAINPFFRDGVAVEKLDARIHEDPTQLTSAAIIKQVGQVTLLRVVLPWMIGKAFDRLSDPVFIDRLGEAVKLPVPVAMRFLLGGKERIQLKKLLEMAAGPDEEQAELYRQKVGAGVKEALQAQFAKYDLTGKTWADLTQSKQAATGGEEPVQYVSEAGSGFLNRGAARYQLLVPAYTVMFAFSLVLTVGWLFVLERRQGTLKRLRAAPLTRGEIVLGKFLPCFALSVAQGAFLLTAGKLAFGMSWGPAEWSLGRQILTLAPVVVTTSLAAMGLALLIAALARTEIQVALVGSLLVLVLALLSGCLIPRELMPEAMIEASHFTPHAWALDAYRQLLMRPAPGSDILPNMEIVARSCLVLAGYGAAFIALAWGLLRLD